MLSQERRLQGVAGLALFLIMTLDQRAGAQTTLPDLIKPPAGLDFGYTSFFDAAGSLTPGFVYSGYLRLQHFDDFTNSDGNSSPEFSEPRLNDAAFINQIIYTSPLQVGGGAFGFMAILPFVGYDANFHPPGHVLTASGPNFGDITFGVNWSKPFIVDGRPILFMRAEFDVATPTGHVDTSNDINQGAGFWSLNPYIALTYLPLPRLEFSTRLNYLYNYQTTTIGDPPMIPGFVIRSGQAAPLMWDNFAASYAFWNGFSLGVNGYYVLGLGNDKLNGIEVPDSEEKELYLGPGFHWTIDAHNVVNANLYLPVKTENVLQGPQINIQYVHPF